jgi:hypothetical protein
MPPGFSILYEVIGLHDAAVWVIQGLLGDKKMIVTDQFTGLKYEVEDFVPNKIGEYHAAKDSPDQKARKAAKELTGLTNTLYMKPAESISQRTGGKVAQIPTRIKETRQIENPLDTDRMPSLDAAMREFYSLTGLRLESDDRAAVVALIEQNGLSQKFVVNLAMQVETEQNNRRYAS